MLNSNCLWFLWTSIPLVGIAVYLLIMLHIYKEKYFSLYVKYTGLWKQLVPGVENIEEIIKFNELKSIHIKTKSINLEKLSMDE